jgi:hypothetical protein
MPWCQLHSGILRASLAQGPTIINKAKEAIMNATETDRFLVKSVQGVLTAGNEKGIRYATTKNTLFNDVN